jgi:type IV secretion system protein VirB3
MDGEDDVEKYLSYNSLSRTPLMFGVPLIVLLFLLLLILITTIVGVSNFGVYGLAFPILLVCLLIFVRMECKEDSRALDWLVWDIKGWLDKQRCGSDVISITSNINHLDSQETVLREWIKNNSSAR